MRLKHNNVAKNKKEQNFKHASIPKLLFTKNHYFILHGKNINVNA